MSFDRYNYIDTERALTGAELEIDRLETENAKQRELMKAVVDTEKHDRHPHAGDLYPTECGDAIDAMAEYLEGGSDG